MRMLHAARVAAYLRATGADPSLERALKGQMELGLQQILAAQAAGAGSGARRGWLLILGVVGAAAALAGAYRASPRVQRLVAPLVASRLNPLCLRLQLVAVLPAGTARSRSYL